MNGVDGTLPGKESHGAGAESGKCQNLYTMVLQERGAFLIQKTKQCPSVCLFFPLKCCSVRGIYSLDIANH